MARFPRALTTVLRRSADRFAAAAALQDPNLLLQLQAAHASGRAWSLPIILLP